MFLSYFDQIWSLSTDFQSHYKIILLLLLLLLLLPQLPFYSVAVVLTLIRTKQISIHKRKNAKIQYK